MRGARALLFSAAPRPAPPASGAAPPRVTLAALARKHAALEPLVVLTAYDAPTASLADAHADMLLVGDSVGMVVHGRASTVRVSLDDMALHCAAVARGARRALLVGDLPFGSYATPARAAAAALRLAQQGGMHAVKLEGGRAQAPKLAAVRAEGVPVMAHVGLLPQTATLGSGGAYAVQGRSAAAALAFVEDALAAERAGAFAAVFELVPAQLAAFASALLAIPSIGIGAGPFCGGQVLVLHDMVGLHVVNAAAPPQQPQQQQQQQQQPSQPPQPRFVRRYAELGAALSDACARFAGDVRTGRFPGVLGEGGESGGAAAGAAAPLAGAGAPSATSRLLPPPAPPPLRQAFFDMAPRELDAFRELAQTVFRGEARALSALDAAADELEARLRGGPGAPAGLQAATTADLYRRSAARPRAPDAASAAPAASAATAPTAAAAAARAAATAAPPLSVAILGSGAVASLVSAALGGGGGSGCEPSRLAMFSSWSARLADIRARGGVRWRRNVDGEGDGALALGAPALELRDLAAPGERALRNALKRVRAALECEPAAAAGARAAAGGASAGGSSVRPATGTAAADIVDAEAAALADVLGRFDVVLLCGKAHQVEAQAALAALLVRPRLGGDSGGLVLPLYNGDDSLECLRECFAQLARSGLGGEAAAPLQRQLAGLSEEQVAYGQTSVGACYVAEEDEDAGGDGVAFGGGGGGGGGSAAPTSVIVEHTGDGATLFCAPTAAAATALRTALGAGGGLLRARAGPELGTLASGAGAPAFEALRWRKLAVNALLNPVCALLGLRNGGFPAAARSGPFRRRVAALAEEASRALELRAGAAAAEGARALLERAESVAAATAANTNSMLADLRAGRASEAPFIGGAVVRALAAAGERAPASEAALAAISAREAALGVAPLEAAALARVLARAASARARVREGQ